MKIVCPDAMDKSSSVADKNAANALLYGGTDIAEHTDEAHGRSRRFLGRDIHGEQAA